MHRLGGQQDGEFHHQLPFRTDRAQVQLSASYYHVVEDCIQRELVFTRPLRNQLSDPRAVVPDECRRRLRPMMSRIVGEQPPKIAIVGLRRVEGVESQFLPVVFGKRVGQLTKRFYPLPAGEQRALLGNLAHQIIDVFKLLQDRPAGVARPPVRAGAEPHCKCFCEILVRMALSVP